jgi:hypothetical protein
MTQENTIEAQQLMRTGRSGISRKLLQRKAAERAIIAPATDALEASFPVLAEFSEEPAQELEGSPSSHQGATQAPATAMLPLWSSEDEVSLQTLLARRKAAAYQRRGKDVAGQVIRPGPIKPNEGTVAAVIGDIVAHAGTMSRGAIVDAMATANFPHPKARPTDKGWCQGYVAGAIRNGFLAMAEQSATLVGELSAKSSEISANLAESSATVVEA